MIQEPYALTGNLIADQLGVNLEKGLSNDQVEEHRKKYGGNILTGQYKKNAWIILLEQFLDPVIYVLGVATFIAFLFNEILEAIAVLVVILITASIGFVMELQAVRSIEALRKMTQVVTHVIRNGEEQSVQAGLLVPGDIILLNTGDFIAADARIISHQKLAVNEASLTGESYHVEKSNSLFPQNTFLTDQKNMVFKGTLVTRGSAKAIITAVGDSTEFGKIGHLALNEEKEKTPLEKRLNQLSHRLIWFTLILALSIGIIGYLQGKDIMLMIKTGLALAVAAIPEGLPIVATIALAKGMLKLAKKQVVIKKLEVVQSLGEMGIICTDKTGTLTENKMEVNSLVLGNDGFQPLHSRLEEPIAIKENHGFNKVIEIGVLCNDVRLSNKKLYGDPLEIALIEFAQKNGYDPISIRKEYHKKLVLPFDAETKKMATVHTCANGYYVCAKGAFENLIQDCNTTLVNNGIVPIDKRKWTQVANDLASEGLRILAFAYKETEALPETSKVYEDLIFLGIVGFLDPPRKDVKDTIKIYYEAGIKVIMVTGDHPETARKVAGDIGLIKPDENDDVVIHGKNLAKLKKESLKGQDKLLNAVVFARVTPEQKLDLVNLYQEHNYVVAMTGDGVNDVPALKKADIGIAMGIRGTEAAKEIADVILKDDRFTSTEMAIRQGRVIFDNIRQFVVYLLSSNFAEISSVAITFIFNLPSPLLPLQILFLNLVTDVFPALALGMGKGENDIMNLPPRKANEPIMTNRLWGMTILYGLSISLAVVGITIYSKFVLGLSPEIINNMGFYTLVFVQLLNVCNVPLRNRSFFNNNVVRNTWIWGAVILCVLIMVVAYHVPILRNVLSLVPMSTNNLLLVLIFGLSALFISQILKRIIFKPVKLKYNIS